MMVAFAFMFTVMGVAIPRIYLRYLDQTQYYKIINPITTDQQIYHPGDVVKVSITRESLIDINGESVIELVLVDKNNVEVAREKRELSISKGTQTVCTFWTLPATLHSGEYFFQGNVHYVLQGIDKYTPFYSTRFFIQP